MVDQFEVDQANLAGRLHPSQRATVVGGVLPFGILFVLIAVAIMAFLFGTAIANDMFEPIYLVYMIPVYVLFLGGLRMAVRRTRDLVSGKVVAVTGWSGPELPPGGGDASSKDNYGKKTFHDAAAQKFYRVQIGERRFEVDKKLYDRTAVNCMNTAFFTSCTHRILNIARTPGH